MRHAVAIGALVLLANVSFASAETRTLEYAGAKLVVTLDPGRLDLKPDQVFRWVQDSAGVVTAYLGHFPVERVNINIDPVAEVGPRDGETRCGVPPTISLRLGWHTTAADIRGDDVMTHEMMHLAMPNVDHGCQGWAAEGLATYVEAVARLKAGRLDRDAFWKLLAPNMLRASRPIGNLGLDGTNGESERYAAGVLFWLQADVTIRRTSSKALVDALRGLHDAGGSVSEHWPVEEVLKTADAALDAPVLLPLRNQWHATRLQGKAERLLADLGVRVTNGAVTLDDAAPLANIRRAIDSAGLQITRR